jgi:hypothetical protein
MLGSDLDNLIGWVSEIYYLMGHGFPNRSVTGSNESNFLDIFPFIEWAHCLEII